MTTAGAGAALLRGTGLGKRFRGQVALADVDVRVEEGASLALLGPNGSGKTTLLRLLAGVARPDSGAVERAEGRGAVGWVPQHPALYQRLTTLENLIFFASVEGAADPRAVADELLVSADLTAFAGRLAAQLSTGTVQRLNLAIALAGRPSVLLLDEPTATLSPDQRHRLWEWLHRLRSEEGLGLVFSTQELDETARNADRMMVLAAGRVVLEGPANALGDDLERAEREFMRLTDRPA